MPVPAVGSAREARLEEPVTVLLAVKSHQTASAVEDLVGGVPDGTPVVSLQNGIANEDTLLRFFADVQGVCVMMPTGHLSPGVVVQQCAPVPGILDVGAVPGGATATSEAVATAFRAAGFVSEPRADVLAWKRRKLLMNLGNAVQACCGNDDPDADELRDLARAEGVAALAAAGLTVVSASRTAPVAVTSSAPPTCPATPAAAAPPGRACGGRRAASRPTTSTARWCCSAAGTTCPPPRTSCCAVRRSRWRARAPSRAPDRRPSSSRGSAEPQARRVSSTRKPLALASRAVGQPCSPSQRCSESAPRFLPTTITARPPGASRGSQVSSSSCSASLPIRIGGLDQISS